MKPSITIEYCTRCRWLLRAGWLAQELLQTFDQDLDQVALVPSDGGIFRIKIEGHQVWDRQVDGGFPEAKVLKQRTRDFIDPSRDLGHVDSKASSTRKSSKVTDS